jgi:hypothetical protein
MSTADDPEGPPSADPKRSRRLIVGVALGAVVVVIAFMVLVSQCGTDNGSEIYGAGVVPPSAGSSAVR